MSNAAPGRTHSAAGHVEQSVTSLEKHVHVEKLWRKYFKTPNQWWDRRSDKLHIKSPDFRHKRTKEALWIDSSGTPEWVKRALDRKSSQAGVGSGNVETSSLAECNTGNAVALLSSQRGTSSWTALISQLSKSGQAKSALKVYKEMREKGVKPSSYTFVAVLKACSSLHDLESAQQLHAEVVESGFESIVNVGNVLVDVYAKCGSLEDARRVFEKMPHRNVVSWNAMILGYAQMDKGEVALQLYAQMQQKGTVPTDRTFVAVLRACSSLAVLDGGSRGADKNRCLKQVRAIHSDIVRNGCESAVFVGTALVDAFAKCGSLVDARGVFEKMPHRNVVSWNAMITGYAQMGEADEALQLYAWMQQLGMAPDDRTFVSVLKACSSLAELDEGHEYHGRCVKKRCLEQVQTIHSAVKQSGVESDVFVGNMLIDVYAKCGSLGDARHVFETMPHQNVVSWNAMIMGYSQMGEGEQALQLYVRMQDEGVVPNNRTFIGALKACTSLAQQREVSQDEAVQMQNRSLEEARAIHSDVVKGGLQLDVFVGNMLVDVYAKCGSLVDARRVFESIPHRSVVSWNAMILGCADRREGEEALELYTRMQQEGVGPDDRTYVGVLKACSCLVTSGGRKHGHENQVKKRCLDQVREIHSHVVKSELESSIFVGNMLVDVYAKCGSLVDARSVFEKIPNRNVVSWNAMILGYAQAEDAGEALHLYSMMQKEGVQPNERTFVSALKACSSLASLEEGKQADSAPLKQQCLEQVRAIHSLVKGSCYASDIFVETMLVDSYAKCGSLVDARCVFDNMRHRDAVSWNAIILGYAQMEKAETSLQLYALMQKEGVSPNDRTFVGALKACSSLAALGEAMEADDSDVKQQCLEHVRAIHSDLLNTQSGLDVFVGTMLVDVYAKCGSLSDARTVFEKMPHRDVATWNAIISGYAHIEDSGQALQLYKRMQNEGVGPNDRTFIGALKACGLVAGLDKGKEIHAQISKHVSGESGLFVPTALIDMYGKCGSMVDAQQVFDALPTRDLVTWSALIAGYARQGESEVVLDLFDRMRKEGIEPNGITFLSVLTACSHAALVEVGQKYFDAMSRDHGITPSIEHYNCMIDLLGRAGKVDQAMEVIKSMPYQPSGDAWRCVLAACRKWGNVTVGKDAFDCAVRLDKNDAAAYVLMSNIYAAARMWEDARKIRALQVRTHAWKKPGQSWWTDMDGIVHTFVAGDKQHPESQDISAKMQHLFLKMKNRGYVPHLESVLRNIPDDEKEDALCGHSEKLAICYALLKTPEGTVIRVTKNLRVCEDCHRATALIAKMEQRTIICRDATRFHVFKDGKCSCGGYW